MRLRKTGVTDAVKTLVIALLIHIIGTRPARALLCAFTVAKVHGFAQHHKLLTGFDCETNRRGALYVKWVT